MRSDPDKGDLEFRLEDILAEFGQEGPETQPTPEKKAAPGGQTAESTATAVPGDGTAVDIDDIVYPAPAGLAQAPVIKPQAAQVPPPEEPAQGIPELSELLSMEVAIDESEGDVTSSPFEPLPPDDDNRVRSWEGEVVAPLPEGGLERDAGRKAKKAARARSKWAMKVGEATLEEDEVPLPKALKRYSRSVKSIWPRMLLALLACLPAVYITIADAFGLPLPAVEDYSLLRWLLVAVNALVALLCLEVPAEGVYALLKLRPGVETGVLIATLVAIAQAAVMDTSKGLPYCAVTTVAIFMAQWGTYYGKSAVRRNLRAAMGAKEPYAVVRQENGFDDGPAFFKTAGDTEGFVTMTESEDCAKRAFAAYVPILAAASFLFAALCLVLKKADFLASWAACLCAGLPMAGALSYAMPFSALTKRLSSVGAAIGGWEGARAMSGKAAVVVADRDLFPQNAIRIEGLKIFGSFSVDRVVGYTTALISASGCCLTEVFQKTLENENAKMPRIDTFQTYEGGGLGAEINGDLVLVGSSSFMTLMGIKIAAGSKIRYGVYIAINGELAGLFAVDYRPAKSVSFTLLSMLQSKKLTVVMAVRDFNITPTMIRRSFDVNCDTIEMPTIEQRVDLSDPDTLRPGQRAALIMREGLTPFGDAVVGGRALRKIALFNTVFSLVGGAVGLVLMFYLTFMGAATVTVAGYVLTYTLAWTLPVLLISGWAGKY